LVWSDEFDDPNGLDTEVWNFDIGTGDNGWGNAELQYYTDREENIKVEDGMLVITALQENFSGSAYTSARITSKGNVEQEYGRIEARMQLPWGQGLWPAFWMLGNNIDEVSWPQCGEIDIMEFRGQAPTITTGTVHGPGYSGGDAIGKEYDLVNQRLDEGFNVYGIEWGPEYINFYINDVLFQQITPEDVTGEWVFNRPFYMLLNMAVGGTFVGSPSPDTVFPQELKVDYVRIYN
ncbi:MAG: glycoside hydrolase family 16 protein, partial [Bacteroidota bacterium]